MSVVEISFVEKTVKKFNGFLVTFQTSALVVPFLVDSLESLVRGSAESFTLPDVLKMVNPTYKLSQLGMNDEDIQKWFYEVSFSIEHDLHVLNKAVKITDSKMNTF